MFNIVTCQAGGKMICLRLCFLVMFLVVPLGGTTYGATVSVQEAAKRLQEKYDTTSSMSAEFSQVTSSQMSSRTQRGSGSLILLKPGRMRWDYQEPDRQVIVCDGKNITMYFAQENQMLVSPAKQYLESDVTYSFFAGTGNLLRDFTISAPSEEEIGAEKESGAIVIRLSPKKEHPQIDFITVWTSEKFLMNRLQIVDKFGSKTDIKFTNMKLNPKIAEVMFDFSPPEGTEIIKQ